MHSNPIFPVALVLMGLAVPCCVEAQNLECQNWQQSHPEWLWCDDFESDSSLEQNYFDLNRASGRLSVSSDASFGGNSSVRGTYVPGERDSGSLKFSFGKTPVAPKRFTDQNFSEVYWRFYLRTSPNWTDNAYKITRATIFAASNWSQAAIGHLWEDGTTGLGMGLDPATGVVGGQVVTTKYNDFDNLRWLGKANGTFQMYGTANRGVWTCIEIHMKLNTPGQADGTFAYWVNGGLQAAQKGLNWRGSYQTYGINAIMLENYKNDPASQTQHRYFDNFVISRGPIGCIATGVRPNPPTDVQSN